MRPPEIHFAQGPEGRVAYQVLGDGPMTLYLASSPPLNLEMAWEFPPVERFLKRLASFSRLIVSDVRGAGISDPVPRNITIEEWVTDFECVMDDAGIERAAVMGIDNSGPPAILIGATYPERVDSLILLNCYATLARQPDYPWGMPPEVLARLGEALRSGWGTTGFLRLGAPELMDDRRFQDQLLRIERLGMNHVALQAFTSIVTTIDLRGILTSIKAPTLVIAHEGSIFVRPGHGRFLAENIPNAKLVEQPGFWGLSWLHAVDGTLGEVQSFLTGTRGIPDFEDRPLATLLFTDIVEATGRAAELLDKKWRHLLDEYEALMREQIERFRGRLVKSTGDGVLATFDGPARAIRCALAMRERARSMDIETYAGLHTGEIEVRGEDIAGIAVHIAARVREEAGPGEILVSGSVPPLVAGSGMEFDDRGLRELKGVPGEWRLFAVRG